MWNKKDATEDSPEHSDPNSKKVSKKSYFVWKYIKGFHLFIKGNFCTKNSYFSISSNKYIFWPFYLVNYKKINV